MASIPSLPVPKAELVRVATANVELLDVAKTLMTLASQTNDPQAAQTLREQAQKILDTSNTVSSAVRSASYLAS